MGVESDGEHQGRAESQAHDRVIYAQSNYVTSGNHVGYNLYRFPAKLSAVSIYMFLGSVLVVVAAPIVNADNRGRRGNGWSDSLLKSPWFIWCVFLILFAVLVALILFLVTRQRYMANENRKFEQAVKAEEEYKREVLEKLKKETELATLMGLNQRQIDEYHRIVTYQADKAFRSSRIAMNVGLTLLVSAALAGMWVQIEEIRWFLGALAVLSTLLSGYLGRTYLTLYRESVGQLGRYFDQPVLNGHYLTAERLAESLDREDSVDVRRFIIKEVLEASRKTGNGDVKMASRPRKFRG